MPPEGSRDRPTELPNTETTLRQYTVCPRLAITQKCNKLFVQGHIPGGGVETIEGEGGRERGGYRWHTGARDNKAEKVTDNLHNAARICLWDGSGGPDAREAS